MSGIKIFGRFPAFYVGALEALIAVLVTFNLSGLSEHQAAYWVACIVAIGGVLTSWTTRDTLLAALVAAVKATLVLAVAYSVPITDEQIGLIAAFVNIVGSGFLHSQTSPVPTPLTRA